MSATMDASTPDNNLSKPQPGFRWGLWVAVAASLLLRLILVLTDSLGFHSDEAINLLMARHILQGARPIFMYGQNYMGSLDNYMVAGVFALLGQSVKTGRIVAPLVMAGVAASTYFVALKLSRGSRAAASIAALLTAVPPVMVTVFTSLSLGAYVETLLLNNLLLLLGWDILNRRKERAGWWLLAGFLCGIGWWEFPLIVVSAAPLTILGIWRFRKDMPWKRLGVLLVGFVIGSLPWWIAVASDPSGVLGDLVGARMTKAVGSSEAPVGLGGRAFTLFFLTLPALFGLRPAGSVWWILLPVGFIAVNIYLAALLWAVRETRQEATPPDRRIGFLSLLGGFGFVVMALLLTSFGLEPTGRNLLTAYPLLAIMVGDFAGHLAEGKLSSARLGRWMALGMVLLLVGYNLWGIIRSATRDPRLLSYQLSDAETLPRQYDDDLIGFLDSIGVDRGYSNFWAAFRFAFLTHERIILAPAVPYKESLIYTSRDNRYQPYMDAVRAADEVVYVTASLPALDEVIRDGLDDMGVTYDEHTIGPYTVFYNLSEHVYPEELDIVDPSAPERSDTP